MIIIEETKNFYLLQAKLVGEDVLEIEMDNGTYDAICLDAEQAKKLIDVLKKFINGEDI